MTSALLRALKSPTGLLPTRSDLHCWLRRQRHVWTDMSDPASCVRCGVSQLIPRDPLNIGD